MPCSSTTSSCHISPSSRVSNHYCFRNDLLISWRTSWSWGIIRFMDRMTMLMTICTNLLILVNVSMFLMWSSTGRLEMKKRMIKSWRKSLRILLLFYSSCAFYTLYRFLKLNIAFSNLFHCCHFPTIISEICISEIWWMHDLTTMLICCAAIFHLSTWPFIKMLIKWSSRFQFLFWIIIQLDYRTICRIRGLQYFL